MMLFIRSINTDISTLRRESGAVAAFSCSLETKLKQEREYETI